METRSHLNFEAAHIEKNRSIILLDLQIPKFFVAKYESWSLHFSFFIHVLQATKSNGCSFQSLQIIYELISIFKNFKQPAQKITGGFKYYEYNEAYNQKETISLQRHKHDKKKAKKLVFFENSHRHRSIIFILERILQEIRIRRWPKDSLTSKTIFHISVSDEKIRSNRYF